MYFTQACGTLNSHVVWGHICIPYLTTGLNYEPAFDASS